MASSARREWLLVSPLPFPLMPFVILVSYLMLNTAVKGFFFFLGEQSWIKMHNLKLRPRISDPIDQMPAHQGRRPSLGTLWVFRDQKSLKLRLRRRRWEGEHA